MTLKTVTKNEPIVVNEKRRTYKFHGGDSITLLNVVEIIIHPSGTHRLKTADGHLHIVRSNWYYIEIDSPVQEWAI